MWLPLGYGSSAVVYEAIYKPLKKRVAIKMIDLDMFERNQIDELRVFIDTFYKKILLAKRNPLLA